MNFYFKEYLLMYKNRILMKYIFKIKIKLSYYLI